MKGGGVRTILNQQIWQILYRQISHALYQEILMIKSKISNSLLDFAFVFFYHITIRNLYYLLSLYRTQSNLCHILGDLNNVQLTEIRDMYKDSLLLDKAHVNCLDYLDLKSFPKIQNISDFSFLSLQTFLLGSLAFKKKWTKWYCEFRSFFVYLCYF